ncbi:hypothetical protein [Alishewanella longhuensis]
MPPTKTASYLLPLERILKMAYQPRLPKTNPNIGRQRPLQDLLLIGSALLALLFSVGYLAWLLIKPLISCRLN